MKQQNISVLLSEKNIEVIESILKNSNYFYEIVKTPKVNSSVLIIDDTYLNEELDIESNNLQKVICIIPNKYLKFIADKFKTEKKITFLELPITYDKLIKILKKSFQERV